MDISLPNIKIKFMIFLKKVKYFCIMICLSG
ncbi:hypothetical protein cco10_03720 [Campylobacter coli 90-3]|nr:hypothetical protein YSQ_02300 [Campylobacter coli RM1875]AHK77269.1 hypothetical protein YSS_07115 [Campylobacter coli RM4661]EIA44049.1 hypothetical protein cco10_03720 [Campylobacter coli 90-3]EIA50175.1 hypothetical protein cco106_06175 [Campylobacter coli 2553]EIA52092.1 hypothetical protein cco113_09719 [Campylobacter coli 2688]EIA60313.1 hypothetical protein cco16_08600 [Campylobacter coli 86119]EIA69308.1 hypothetical protein cco37_05585 [Campylobacter coli 1417]EIA79344.1 hypothe